MTECVKPVHLPNHLSILTAHSGLLRTTLADQIGIVAHKLHERFAVHDYQLKKILKTATQKPEDGVSLLISYIKGSQDHFDKFIQCLSDLGYTGLVQTITGTGSAAVEIPEIVPRTITNITVPSPTTPPTPPKPQVQRRKMPSASERKIESNFDYLVNNIREPIQLCEILYQKGVFNKTDIDTCRIIYEREGRGNATKILLFTLLDRGDVYDICIQCLKECGYKSVVDRLENGQFTRDIGRRIDWVMRGRMRIEDLRIWIRATKYLFEQFTPDLDLIQDTMFHHHIIDETDKQQIEKERVCKSDRHGAIKLVEILGYRGKNVLPRIIAALESINHDAATYLQDRINGLTKRRWGMGSSYTGHVIGGFIQYDKVHRGKMEPCHYLIWKDEHEYLVEQFTLDLDLIKDTMYQHHIIDDKDKQQIEKEGTHTSDENGAEKLVEILGHRGQNALPRIIEALKTINHDASEHLQARINGSTKRKWGNVE
ncbi:uncharacterized protein LOC130013069 [Patella vulgata]|uniref:uncharacterized protein LOC130013069 n=1 Tax=Patella vulgata TaxID=6465 RepID=UPI0024A98D29|nr:uncharacterized protein LOC130013069 [Patella vulgata]XP_055957505.1 uncharacterized protein LOC130013069 [Patella vulgata]